MKWILALNNIMPATRSLLSRFPNPSVGLVEKRREKGSLPKGKTSTQVCAQHNLIQVREPSLTRVETTPKTIITTCKMAAQSFQGSNTYKVSTNRPTILMRMSFWVNKFYDSNNKTKSWKGSLKSSTNRWKNCTINCFHSKRKESIWSVNSNGKLNNLSRKWEPQVDHLELQVRLKLTKTIT
jgi:hypothetical protein